MKHIIAAFLFIGLYSSIAIAQFEKDCVELSLSGSIGSLTETGSAGSISISQSFTYLFLTTALDYYVSDGLSLEPEIGFMAIEKSSPSQSVLLNLSYTSRLPKSMVALFLRGGYGLGNSLTISPYGNIPMQISNKWDVNTLNFGAGLKILFNENVALRTELNYRRQSFTRGSTYYSSSQDYVYSNVGLLLGFSILLH